MEDPDLYSGLIRLHVLHHAARGPIYGLAIIEELARHGYRMSPGTMYPLLRGLHAKGYLRVREVREGIETALHGHAAREAGARRRQDQGAGAVR